MHLQAAGRVDGHDGRRVARDGEGAAGRRVLLLQHDAVDRVGALAEDELRDAIRRVHDDTRHVVRGSH